MAVHMEAITRAYGHSLHLSLESEAKFRESMRTAGLCTCRTCKHWQKISGRFPNSDLSSRLCELNGAFWKAGDYCSRGEWE